MLSQTGTYALQAALHLARREGRTVAAGTMALELEVPGTYLAKVLHRLAREGVLDSTRGPRGGYQLSSHPSAITVAAVVAPFQELRPSRQCLLGGPCDLEQPCAAHERRSAWTAAALEILEATTLADLLEGTPLPDLPAEPNGTEARP